jgi:hypothetical protein
MAPPPCASSTLLTTGFLPIASKINNSENRANTEDAMNLKVAAACCVSFLLLGCGKPAQITNNCTLNGYGDADCEFLNKGEQSGAKCVKLVLEVTYGADDGKQQESRSICSGKLEGGAVTDRSVSAVFPESPVDFCTDYSYQSWDSYCQFNTVETKE